MKYRYLFIESAAKRIFDAPTRDVNEPLASWLVLLKKAFASISSLPPMRTSSRDRKRFYDQAFVQDQLGAYDGNGFGFREDVRGLELGLAPDPKGLTHQKKGLGMLPRPWVQALVKLSTTQPDSFPKAWTQHPSDPSFGEDRGHFCGSKHHHAFRLWAFSIDMVDGLFPTDATNLFPILASLRRDYFRLFFTSHSASKPANPPE